MEIIREQALKKLEVLINTFNDNNITWWLMYGTALGAVREGHMLLKENEDIDLGMHYNQVNTMFFNAMYNAGFDYYTRWFILRDAIKRERFYKYGTITLKHSMWDKETYPIDIYVFYPTHEDNYIWLKYEYRGNIMGKLYPKKYIDNLTSIKLGWLECYVPSPPEEFCEYLYGPTWMTPIETWGADEQRLVNFWPDGIASEEGSVIYD